MLSSPIDQEFIQAIERQTFSGAQVVVGRNGKRLFHQSYGMISQQTDALPILDSTLFDIASLTKPVCTTTLIMMAIEAGLIKLEDKVEKFLPEFNRAEKITLRDCLSHTSGFPDWLPLYAEVCEKKLSLDQVREVFIAQINRTPLLAPVGEKRIYSDLGFILLGFVLEKVYASPLNKLFASSIAQPLAMTQTLFNPLLSLDLQESLNIAATEACPWRQRVLQAEVHDDNAYVLGGVAGHAGLFSTALDLEKFVHSLLEVWQGKSGLFSQVTLQNFIGEKQVHKLGWDTVSLPLSQAGRHFSPKTSIGHLAFTGCSLWIDLSDQKYIILFTNRVHPSRNNEEIKNFRPRIQDLIIEAFQI